MIRWMICAGGLVLASALLGCGGQESPAPESNGATTAPEADYDAEARETITEENLDEEVEALEQQIEADERDASGTE